MLQSILLKTGFFSLLQLLFIKKVSLDPARVDTKNYYLPTLSLVSIFPNYRIKKFKKNDNNEKSERKKIIKMANK